MSIPESWPEHQNPQDSQHIASAPYNFVPLPEKIIPAVSDPLEDLPNHDKYYPKRLSGYFEVTLTTRSPLYIRGPLSPEEAQRQEEDAKVKSKPEFFHTGDEQQPVIPGSSLRGMLRALLEIVSYGKVQWVSERQLFFRTVDTSAVGKYYNQRMVKDLGDVQKDRHPQAPGYHARVEGGFFRIRENGTYFIEKCTVARVETEDLLRLFGLNDRSQLYQLDGRDLYAGSARNPNQTPNWRYQHRKIWADIDRDEKDYFFSKKFIPDSSKVRHRNFYLRFLRARDLAANPVQGKQSGKLVLTGPMNFKHLEFLFVPSEGTTTKIDVRNDPSEQNSNKRLLDRFHDDDQLTRWQKKAFPVDRLPNRRPEPDGRLRDGDPVFFLREKGELTFIGRAQMFRLPYEKRPLDLVPPALRRAADIDYAEALFGFVRTHQELTELGTDILQGDKRRAYAGRVIVTDGVLQSNQTNIWLAEKFDEEITPRILASPKPTAFQLYLTQQNPDKDKELDHYDTPLDDSYKTVIRGHKRYWPQDLGTDQEARKAIEEHIKPGPEDTQHTRFKPLNTRVKFSFQVHFENLSASELGALCWTLHPHGEEGKRYYHHLGMGKPLGMGAVELHAHLHIIDRAQHYKTLFNSNGDNWQLGEVTASESTQPGAGVGTTSTGEDLADRNVLAHRTQAFENHLLHELNPNTPPKRLADMLRIAILLKLLEWPGYRAKEEEPRYLATERRPNTRYMKIQSPNEYRYRPVLPDPTQFDKPYFERKLRPQSPLADLFPIDKELRNLDLYAKSERGVEVKLLALNPAQAIGFIPKERIDRELDPQISGIVTGLHQEPNGRIVVELNLLPKSY